MAKQKELQKAINDSIQVELEQQKTAENTKKIGDKAEKKESKRDKKKKDVLLSPRQRKRIHYADLTKNKSEAAASKKFKIKESFTSDNDTQPSSKRHKKSLEAKRRGRGRGSSLMSSSQTNE
jgi:hypothetical protein